MDEPIAPSDLLLSARQFSAFLSGSRGDVPPMCADKITKVDMVPHPAVTRYAVL
jgi:hypothetical protein